MEYIENRIKILKEKITTYNYKIDDGLNEFDLFKKLINSKLKNYENNNSIDINDIGLEELSSDLMKDVIELEDDKYIIESIMNFSPKNINELAVAIAVGSLYKTLSESVHIKGWSNLEDIIKNLNMEKYAKYNLFKSNNLFVFKEQVHFANTISAFEEGNAVEIDYIIENINNLMCYEKEVYEYILYIFKILWLNSNKVLNANSSTI